MCVHECVCLCVILFYTIVTHARLCIHHHSEDNKQFHYHKESLCFLIIHLTFSPNYPLNSHQPYFLTTTELFSIPKIVSFQTCCIHEILLQLTFCYGFLSFIVILQRCIYSVCLSIVHCFLLVSRGMHIPHRSLNHSSIERHMY